MSYTKQTWQSGDVITASKLNHIEDGIEAIESEGSSSSFQLYGPYYAQATNETISPNTSTTIFLSVVNYNQQLLTPSSYSESMVTFVREAHLLTSNVVLCGYAAPSCDDNSYSSPMMRVYNTSNSAETVTWMGMVFYSTVEFIVDNSIDDDDK